MSLCEVYEEVRQVTAIKGINIGHIGFIATAGYEDTLDGYEFIDINEVYNV